MFELHLDREQINVLFYAILICRCSNESILFHSVDQLPNRLGTSCYFLIIYHSNFCWNLSYVYSISKNQKRVPLRDILFRWRSFPFLSHLKKFIAKFLQNNYCAMKTDIEHLNCNWEFFFFLVSNLTRLNLSEHLTGDSSVTDRCWAETVNARCFDTSLKFTHTYILPEFMGNWRTFLNGNDLHS